MFPKAVVRKGLLRHADAGRAYQALLDSNITRAFGPFLSSLPT
jgi:hypothetical protein